MTIIHTTRIAIHRITGKLPAWTWRELHQAARQAGDRIPLLIVDDGSQPLVILTLGDYNALVAQEDADGSDHPGEGGKPRDGPFFATTARSNRSRTA